MAHLVRRASKARRVLRGRQEPPPHSQDPPETMARRATRDRLDLEDHVSLWRTGMNSSVHHSDNILISLTILYLLVRSVIDVWHVNLSIKALNLCVRFRGRASERSGGPGGTARFSWEERRERYVPSLQSDVLFGLYQTLSVLTHSEPFISLKEKVKLSTSVVCTT